MLQALNYIHTEENPEKLLHNYCLQQLQIRPRISFPHHCSQPAQNGENKFPCLTLKSPVMYKVLNSNNLPLLKLIKLLKELLRMNLQMTIKDSLIYT